MLTSPLQVARSVSVRVPFFRSAVLDGNEAPQTGWAPSSITVCKAGSSPYAKSLTSGVNFFEVDAMNMQGVYEVVLDASDVDTIGYVTITDGAASSITIEVVEKSNTLLSTALASANADVLTAQGDVAATQASVGFASTDNQSVNRVLGGKWKMDSVNNTLTVYDQDGSTAIVSLALASSAGTGTTTAPTQTTSTDPSLFALSPSTGIRWFASRTVTISGKNLPAGCTVTFGSTTGIVPSASSATSITFTFPESELYEVGAKTVRVVPPSGNQPNALTYTVIHPPFQFAGYRADNVVLNGANVSSWTDYTGKGRNISQATSAQQPPYQTSNPNFNGQSSVNFTGTSYRLMSAFDTTLSDPYTGFVVARKTSFIPSAGWAYRASSPPSGAGIGITSYLPAATWFRSTSSTIGTASTIDHPKPLIPVALIGSFGYPGRSQIETAPDSTKSDVATFTTQLPGLSIGQTPNTLNTGDIEVAEIALFSQPLTTAQKAVLYRYSSRKYKCRWVTSAAGASLPQSRGAHSIGKLPDGRIAVFGGVSDPTGTSPTNLTSLIIYDPATNAWSACAATPAALGSNFTKGRDMAIMADGRIFCKGDTIYAGIYDPASDSWVTLTTPYNFALHNVLGLQNNKVMVVGDLAYNLPGGIYRSSAWIYDPSVNSFTILDTTNVSNEALVGGGASFNSDPLAIVASNGNVVCTTASTIVIYNPTSNTWHGYAASLAASFTQHYLSQSPDGLIRLWTPFSSSFIHFSLDNPAVQTAMPVAAGSVTPVAVNNIPRVNHPFFADGTMVFQSGDCRDFGAGSKYRIRTPSAVYTGGAGIRLNDGRVMWTGGRTETYQSSPEAIIGGATTDEVMIYTKEW